MKKIIIIILIFSLLLLTACAQSISEVKDPQYVGKKVTVSGTVKTSFKLGSVSGYILEDKTGSISVSSEELPKEGAQKRVTGILIKDTIFGYYIKAD